MKRKLLLFIRFLFLRIFDLTSRKILNPSLSVTCIMLFFVFSKNYGQCSYPSGATQVGSVYSFCIDNSNTINTSNVSSGQYVTLNVIKGFNYTFAVGNAFSGNENLTLFNAATNVNFGSAGYSSGGSGTNLSWTSTISGQIKVLLTNGTCSTNGSGNRALTITLNSLGNTQETQNETASNTWVGHIYNAGGSTPEPFSLANYAGYYNVSSETINENFGGDGACFPVYSDDVQRAQMYTEGFAVRYKMNTTKSGCYIVSITGDDGIRLSLNGTQIFDRWVQQSSTTYSNVLVRLTGNDNFILDYYENSGSNVVGFSMVPFDSNSNTITAPATVNFCSGGDPAVIGGSLQYSSSDASLQNPQLNFQWQISTDGSAFTNIAGATGRTYDPPATTTSVNVVKRYKRVVTFASSMADVNGVKGGCTYADSNIVTITTSPALPVLQTTPTSGTVTQCPSLAGQVYSVTATNALSYTWTVPTGWSITAGQGTNTVTVTTGTSGQNGNIGVTATNACGTTAVKNLAVTVVSGPTLSQPSPAGQTVCINAAMTALSVTASAGSGTISNYKWYSNTTNSNTGGTLVQNANSSATTNSYTPSSATSGTLYYYAIVTNSNNCTTTSAVSGAITVNPVHTISATTAVNQTVCQNSAMSNITFTLGGGATNATVSNLPPGVSYSVSGNTLTISGTPTVIDVYSYSITTTGNSCTVATASGNIIVGIGNNVLTYNNGTSGSVCVEVNENDPVAFTAPAGTYFNTVTFASYGLPSGGCGSYAVGATCHSLTSQSVTEGRVLGNSNTITFRADNDTFGDPCYGTGKRYRGSASYSQPVCNGTDAGVISGSAPTGPGSYTYRWESSTTGTSGSFAPIPSSNVQNYSPGILTQTTYFRRVVTSSGCTNISPVILIRVNERPTSTVSGTRTICNGESTTVSVALTGTAPWNISYTYGATSGTFTTSTNPYTATVSPSTTTTYAITALSDANCSAIASGMSGNAVITVKQIQGTPTILDKTNIDCVGSGTITLGNLTASGWTINQTGPGSATSTITGTGASRQITGLAAGNYTFTVETPNTCVSAATAVQTISDNSSTTWTATGWSNGNPDSTKRIIINSNVGTPFPSGTPVVNGCALTINPGINVTVPKEVTLVITNAVTTDGQLTFESESSLMQTTDVANSGNITYERKITVRRMDLTYWSNPLTKVGGFTMHDLSEDTLLDKYYIYDTTLGWVSKLNGEWPMEKGIGYSIRAPQYFDPTTPADFIGRFVGVPNNGNVDVTVVSGKFNLIGNPYPSAVSANAFITGNTGVGTVYFWTHNSLPIQSGAPGDTNFYYGSTDYAAYNLSGPAGAMLNGRNFDGFIAAGQGFLAKPPAGGVIHFTNSMRRAGNNSQFYKNNNADDLERNRIWLSFTNTQGAYKQLLLGYIEGATNGIDIDYDATTMSSNSYVDFYTINESKKFTIQGRALPFVNTDVIPLGYKTTIAGEFTIAIEDADGFFDSQEVYLEDLTTSKIINLRTENYKFKTEIGTFTDRFKLRYTSKTLGNEEFEDLENSVVVSIKNKVLKINSSKEEIKEVSIYNVGAQLMYTKNNVNSSELVISNLNSSNQVLLVKVTLENGYSFSKKVIYSNL
ncbi:T9SS sorting signal type C domain-containing protein [Flavobacterium sp. 17A]|uniref:T9SS sorting signal type C domain-containing protein n=1 Tax=Flavobacterium potami TaxID=2872310 RepID=A0A9X1HB90_9FLAO|nr:T9SS sorting signal type C domain-containing protein [Flavobacterium potami]MBZ4035596.1 T9SS sorting signal type C domain-containing protein [Flavobacterium potami]